jgi:hypothetical protein
MVMVARFFVLLRQLNGSLPEKVWVVKRLRPPRTTDSQPHQARHGY